MRKLSVLLLVFFSCGLLQSQDLKYYRYDQDLLSKEFHRSRREALRKMMSANSVAVLFSAPARNRSNDVDFDYHQDPNFYYLTGFTEPNCLLVLFKDSIVVSEKYTNEIIFVPDRNPEDETWNGRRAGLEGAMELLGIDAVLLTSSFDSIILNFNKFSKLFYTTPSGVVDDKSNNVDLYNLIESFKRKVHFPSENSDNRFLPASLATLREIKLPEEVVLMRKAVDISMLGHLEMMRKMEQGKTEYEVEAAGEYVFKKSGAEAVGYPSICGGGENSTILHYVSNRKKLSATDLIVLDMGAEYHGYTADITRTLPVGGKFTPEQRQIYDLVLKAHDDAIAACKPGVGFRQPHQVAVEIIKNGLLDLEIIKSASDYSRYFMHGTSHYLGLDVHDMGNFGPLKPGNIITVEPGIYIPEGSPCHPKWWNIGIRIEDDILITKDGRINLSGKLPLTADEIESEMKKQSDFIK